MGIGLDNQRTNNRHGIRSHLKRTNHSSAAPYANTARLKSLGNTLIRFMRKGKTDKT